MKDTMVISANTSRRGFLKYAGGIGAALVGAIAVTWTDAPRAAAATPHLYDVGCCHLATHTPCGGHWDTANFNCPSGTQREVWTCLSGTSTQYYCYECKITEGGSSDCEVGDLEDYKCSNYIFVHV